jgi:aldehyde dehydrogenase (NAD+)
VNQYNILNNNVPFGGKKQSGIGTISSLFTVQLCRMLERCVFSGRELGSYALEEYTSVKAVHWNFGERLEWPL